MFVSTSCYSNEDAFIQRLAKLGCVNADECEPEAFDEAFGSMSECRDRTEDELHGRVDGLLDSGCEYIAENGRECIHATYHHRRDCGPLSSEITDACDAVFVCPGGLELDEQPMSGALELVAEVE
jgi:hypothetical protein